MHVFMLSWDPTLGFMQYLEHFTFLEYLLGFGHEGDRNANDRKSSFDVIQIIKIKLMESGFKALSTDHAIDLSKILSEIS